METTRLAKSVDKLQFCGVKLLYAAMLLHYKNRILEKENIISVAKEISFYTGHNKILPFKAHGLSSTSHVFVGAPSSKFAKSDKIG